MTDLPWRQEIPFRFGIFVREILDKSGLRVWSLAECMDYDSRHCERSKKRDRDLRKHVHFWWWFFWPITLTMTGIAFLGWIAAVLAVYAVLIPVAIGCAPIALLKVIARRAPSERCDATGP